MTRPEFIAAMIAKDATLTPGQISAFLTDMGEVLGADLQATGTGFIPGVMRLKTVVSGDPAVVTHVRGIMVKALKDATFPPA